MMRNPYMDYFGRTTPQYYSADQVHSLLAELQRVKAVAQQQQNQIDQLQAKLRSAQRALAEMEAQTEVAALEAELADWQARYATLEAEKTAAVDPNYDQTDFLLEVLPFVDNLERALVADPDGDSPLHEGIELTLRSFHATLGKLGVTPIKVEGDEFDPHQHEAVAVLPTADVPEGTIAQVEQAGYTYGDRLLRPARVMVAGGLDA